MIEKTDAKQVGENASTRCQSRLVWASAYSLSEDWMKGQLSWGSVGNKRAYRLEWKNFGDSSRRRAMSPR